MQLYIVFNRGFERYSSAVNIYIIIFNASKKCLYSPKSCLVYVELMMQKMGLKRWRWGGGGRGRRQIDNKLLFSRHVYSSNNDSRIWMFSFKKIIVKGRNRKKYSVVERTCILICNWWVYKTRHSKKSNMENHCHN